MARNYATQSTAIWRSPEWRCLRVTDQRMFWLLSSQPNISAAGMLPLTIGRWASMAEDSSPGDIRDSLARLDAAGFVAVDERTEEVLVRSFVRDDNGYGNSKRRPVIRDAAREIESPRLRQVLAAELVKLGLPSEWAGVAPVDPSVPTDRASDALSEGASGVAAQLAADPTESAFGQNVNQQVDSLSDALPDGTSGFERVVVTKGPYVDTSTHNPSSSTLNPRVERAAASGSGTPEDSTEEGDQQSKAAELGAAPTAVAVMERPAPPTVEPAAAPKPRQPALIPKTALRLPEALEIILTDLHNTGHPEATPDDARTIRATIATQYGSKATLQYLRGIARNSGYAGYYADLRRDRAQHVEAQLNKLRSTEPDCEHGTAAGRTPHPTTGALLCPQCRHGAPPTVDNGPTTHPAIAAAINAYRRASTHHIRADQLVVLTQQATGLHARGATAEQLAALAHTAGQAGIALLAAALQGGTTP